MEFKKNKNCKSVCTSEFYYDLFDHGCLHPSSFLDSKSADKVRKAMEVIQEYKEFLEKNELVEYI